VAERFRGARRPIGVRARVLTAVLLLAALAMVVSGTTLLLVQQARTAERIDARIAADVLQFRSLAAGRLGPTNAPPFADVAALLEVAVQRQVPGEDETFMAMINGRPRIVPAGRRPVLLDQEAGLIASLARLPPDAGVRLRTADTAAGPIRYAAVQVRIAGLPEVGTYVVAYALKPSQDALFDAGRIYALVAAGSLALVALAGWLLAGRLLRPLRVLRDAAEDISHTDLSLRIPVTGNDDLSELTRTVNAMLDRLQAAFDTQQQFLDDAGHELRTPLTVVRGHLEVLEAANPAEVDDTRTLVLDELDRMARLVGDLMVLAKARRPDFIRVDTVDLDHLVEDVLGKASALGQRCWTIDALSGRAVHADGQRLTQALLQLAQNAVAHTCPGDEIALGSAVGSGLVQLWVRDTGPGVAPQDAGRIFERFGRATKERGDDGSGLGLAIVSAIATAHGGRAFVTSDPGRGATFQITLPGAALVSRGTL
jgi:two-component system, OmpR family, sensor kinase